MNGFGLVVHFVLRPGQEQAFDDLVQRTVRGIATDEPGTLIYVSHTVTDRPRERIFYELYADEAAFHAHEQQAHTRDFLSARPDFVESFTVDFLSAVTGKTAPANPVG